MLLHCDVHPTGVLLGLGLALAGCTEKDALDTESPWPVDDSDTESSTTDLEVVVVDTTHIEADSGTSPLNAALSITVDGDELLVEHTGVQLAPCDDLAVVGTVDDTELLVEAAYEGTDCGDPSYYDLQWVMDAPTKPGEWTLTAETELGTFVIE